MPELPEVERVRRSLTPHILNKTLADVRVFRAGVIQGPRTPEALLRGRRITSIERHGKQLALLGDDGRVVSVHLGMTGSLCYAPPTTARTPRDRHVHVAWRLTDGGTLAFRDPRRFGGLWTFASREELLEQRWRFLGVDALLIAPAELHRALSRTHRPLKAALLDQGLVAGLGNIYVDELLHAGGWSPLLPGRSLQPADARRMVRLMRALLVRAVNAGGSTLRDYVDGDGAAGGFQTRHRVYGRGGQPCLACRETLAMVTVGGRTTVYCVRCQGNRRLP